MISITVNTNSVRKVKNVEVTATPKEVFDSVGVDYSGSAVTLSGETLRGGDMDKTFEELGVEDGGSAKLYAIVKADGANK